LKALEVKYEQMEGIFREMEEKFRCVYTLSPLGILFYDAEGRLIDANSACLTMFGATRLEEIKGLKLMDFRLPDREKEKLQRGGMVSYKLSFDFDLVKKNELITTVKSGICYFDIQVSFWGVKGGPSGGYLLQIQDITERKLVEEELRTAHQQLLDIIEFLPDATLVIDHNQRVVAWNRAIEEMTGIRKEDIIGRGDFAYALPFYGKPRPMLIDLIFENSREVELQYEYVGRKGKVIYGESFIPFVFNGQETYLWGEASPLFDGNGKIVGAIESIRDITERKHIEDELRRHRDHLEEMVKERTCALKAANEQLQREIAERKRAEGKSWELNQRIANILESITDAFFALDHQWRFTYLNQEARHFFQRVAQDEFIGQCIWNLFADAFGTIFYKKLHQAALTQAALHFENYFFFIDKWIEVHVYPSPEGLSIYFRDITERKQVEKSLIRISKAVESTSDAVIITNVEGEYIYQNKAFQEMFGYSLEELNATARPFLFMLPPELTREVSQAVFNGNSWSGEIKMGTSLGGTIPVLLRVDAIKDDAGKIMGLIGMFTDFTERKRAEEALRASESRFSKVVNTSPNMIAILTLADEVSDGCFLDVNESFLRLTGYCREEVLGRTTRQLNIWEDTGDLAKVRQMLLEQQSVSNLEVNFRTKTGEIRVGLVSIDSIDIGLGSNPCLLVNVNDITESKQMMKEMAHLERLYLIGEMAAGIGHEIRNPMTTVRGFLQMLENKPECLLYREYFALMIAELDRANAIITGFLSLAKNKAVDLKAQNLNDIIKHIIPLIQADALVNDKNVQLALGRIPDLWLDEKEIHQLILNLTRNGLEAMPSGGNLFISTFTEAQEVVLSVQDQGVGIKQCSLEKLGTPFFTTKERGTGLGLAVCYSIAARHNARIKVETGPGGTTFFVRFSL
jgi:two-component system, sporulation sensor kinase E